MFMERRKEERAIKIEVFVGGRWLSREAILPQRIVDSLDGRTVLISADNSEEVFARLPQRGED